MNTSDEFIPGSQYYLTSGATVHFFQELNQGGYLVAPLIEYGGSYDEPPSTELGDPVIVYSLYKTPPIEKLDESMGKLSKEVGELRREKYDLESSIKNLKKNYLEETKKTPVLNMLNLYLEGKANFVTMIPGEYWPKTEVRFGTIDEILMRNDSYRQKDVKLVTLYGKKENGYEWRINEYSDGSGQDRQIAHFFETIEEAQACATKYLDDYLAANMMSGPSLDKLPKWYTCSDEYREAIKQKELLSYHTSLKNLIEKAEDIRNTLGDNFSQELMDSMPSAKSYLPTSS